MSKLSKAESSGKQQRRMVVSPHKYYPIILQIQECLLVILFILYGGFTFGNRPTRSFTCIESVSYVRHSSTNRFRVQNQNALFQAY